MLTMTGKSGYRAASLAAAILLSACSARPVLHEFPQPFAASARAPAAVAYTLREIADGSGDWVLHGERGDLVGGFRWRRAALAGSGGIDDRFQDGINQADYLFRTGVADESLAGSWGGPPRVTIFDAASGERVGQIELHIGFDTRIEGTWRDRAILWRAESLPGITVPRETGDGDVEDVYPAAQMLQWTGGSNAGLRIYGGRVVAGEPPAFAEPVFDVTAGRPLTRRELGDSIVLLFAIRTLEQAAGATSDE